MMEEMATADPAVPPQEEPAVQQGMSDDAGGEPASPEEQALYNQFVAHAWLLVYDKKMLPKVLEMLKGEGDPIEGLARTAALVIGRVASAADKSGQKLSGDVLLHAGKEVFEDLADLSRVAKIKDFSQDEDAFDGALFRTMDQFRVMLQSAGRLNQEAAQADMAKLEQMDQSGELEKMLSGLAAQDSKAKKRPPMEEGGEEAEEKPRGLMKGMN